MKKPRRSCITLTSAAAGVAVAVFGLTPAAGAAAAPVTINLWQCGSGPGAGSCMGAQYPGLVSRFEASHPNIKIVTRYIPFANLDTVFDEAFAAGSGPDIADVNTSGDYGLFSSKGYLEEHKQHDCRAAKRKAI